MLQNIIVYIIGVIVLAYIIVKTIRLITKKDDPCCSCKGCEAKKTFQTKLKQCNEKGRQETTNNS